MQARMTYPANLVPDAEPAIQALFQACRNDFSRTDHGF